MGITVYQSWGWWNMVLEISKLEASKSRVKKSELLTHTGKNWAKWREYRCKGLKLSFGEKESTHWVSLTVNEYLYFNQKCCYILKVYFLLQDRFAAIAQ